MERSIPKREKRVLKRLVKERIFLFCILLYPLLQFIVFYVVVNVNSLFLAFKEYNIETGVFGYVGFKNFAKFFRDLNADPMLTASFKNSTILYLFGLIVSTPLNILISFSIYKKVPLAGVFRVVLFLPSIISGMVFVVIFKYFIDLGIPKLAEMLRLPRPSSLLVNPKTAFMTIILFGLWTGFGVGIVLYSNAMARIPPELVESGELDGMNNMQELWYIVLPLIFPTFTTFLVTGVAGFFTSQGAVYSFYGQSDNQAVTTLGYYFFVKVAGGGAGKAQPQNYPYAAAAGLIFTVVAAPITLVVKWLLERFGPSAEY